jgi:hypothetical protein
MRSGSGLTEPSAVTYRDGTIGMTEVVTVTVVAWAALGLVAVLVVAGAVVAYRIGRRIGGWRMRFREVRSRFLPPGPRRDAALLRCRMHAELRATRDMLAGAPQGLIFRADAAAVLKDLAVTAAQMDGELAAIERFLDAGQQRAALAAVAPQVKQLIDTTYTARQTILRTAVEDRARQLATLRANVAAQAAALDNYRADGRELSL